MCPVGPDFPQRLLGQTPFSGITDAHRLSLASICAADQSGNRHISPARLVLSYSMLSHDACCTVQLSGTGVGGPRAAAASPASCPAAAAATCCRAAACWVCDPPCTRYRAAATVRGRRAAGASSRRAAKCRAAAAARCRAGRNSGGTGRPHLVTSARCVLLMLLAACMVGAVQ